MVTKKFDAKNYFSDLPNIHKYWGWFFIAGVFLIALGLLALGYAGWATEFTVIFLGGVLVLAGVLQIASGFYARKWTGFSLSLLLGLLYLFSGGVCIIKPLDGALSISMLIALVLLVGGVFRMVSALRLRFDFWGWSVFNGIVAILLGILILAEWPASALWVIGFFVGIELVLIGASWIFLSLNAKHTPPSGKAARKSH